MLKTVLCYGDSNTWGYIVGTGKRYPRNIRWPGVLADVLSDEIEVIEEGLPGRTTVWDEPFREGRNGKVFLPTLLESHSPVELLVIMLGTNDMKHIYSSTAHYAATGIRELINILKKPTLSAYNKPPEVLIISPPIIEWSSDDIKLEFHPDIAEESRKFAKSYHDVAKECSCFFLDSSKVVGNSFADGVHLGEKEHLKLGLAVSERVREILGISK